MNVDPIYIVYGLVFIAVFFIVEGIYFVTRDWQQGPAKVNKRLRMRQSGRSAQEVLIALRRERGEQRSAWLKGLSRIDNLVRHAGVSTRTEVLLLIGLAVTVVVGLVLVAFSGLPVPAAWAIAVVAGFGPLFIILAIMRKLRLRKFREQLPDALDTMVRSLRAGHPISNSLQLASSQMKDPIGTELGIAYDEMTYGYDLDTALQNMAERIGLDDFRYVVVAVNIQSQVGGNLAEILEKISALIRERFRTRQKVMALSAEGRVSAMVMGALPICVFAGVWLTNPSYYLDVIDHPAFFLILGGAAVWMVIGYVIMYRMVNFKF